MGRVIKSWGLCSVAPQHLSRTFMPYSDAVKETTRKAPKTLGNQIVRWAVHLDFSIIRIAKAMGSTRQTVYLWAQGTDVSPAYRERAKALLDVLRSSPTADEAWRKACVRFNIKK